MIPLFAGTALALAALSYVLYPLLFGKPGELDVDVLPPISAGDESRNVAVDALREIEFDKATGKLSDTDYSALKASYTQRAVDAMRTGARVECPRCGPRPEGDARFCSNCGALLGG